MSLLSRWGAVRTNNVVHRAFQLHGHPLNAALVRHSSLSAIHRGLRRSDKPRSPNDRSRSNGTGFGARDERGRSRSRNVPERGREREPRRSPDAFADRFKNAAGGPRGRDRDGGREHHFKPKKALQKMEEQEQEGGRKSRSKRFNDPEYSFGKKSMVYQLNRGELKDKVSKLLDKDGKRGRDDASPRPGSAWRENFGRDSGKPWTREPREDRYNSMRSEARRELERDDSASRDRRRPREDTSTSSRFGSPRRDVRREFGRDDAAPQDRRWPREDTSTSSRFGSPRRDVRREFDRGGAAPQDRRRPRSREDSDADDSRGFPPSIRYTTAASQFLFGRSVVKAALKNSQRKLYNLYVYDGDNKRETKDDEWILMLAKKRVVPVTRLHETDQRLMDKMSKGRPHNGLILEASPLPQLPLLGLGPESSELGGYPVSVARQAKEDLDINGTEGLIPWKKGSPRPLVLMLMQILDPGNLGGILRSARYLGASAVVVTKGTSAPISSTVLKAAAGAAEELKIFTVDDASSFLDASQQAGWTTFAAVAPAAGRSETRQWTLDTVEKFDPISEKPCILVVGNEGTGLPHDVRKKATHEVTIPRMLGASSMVDSLNVSVATALLCNSFMRGTQQSQALTFAEKLQVDARKADHGEALF
ncbi:SpoU rRNA methylase [Colletotrichum musicola]|uniref:rRNA methyltransferase 1, mitochondrial n=1 Tax=Colletotrichum musicola TaxID=2175873 RepID=A0A8H6U6X5_9PEZI|nr:SpoU rRNA methylase [Colletotrichum musicola]